MKQCENNALKNKLNIWKNQIKTSEHNFEGHVIDIHSGDSISIIKSDNTIVRVMLAGIKAPTFQTINKQNEVYGFESREYLRELCIGE